MSDEPRPPCGTRSGYNAHLRHGETYCQPCRDAAAAYQRELRATNPTADTESQRKWRSDPQNRAKQRAAKAAQGKATRALAARHVDEYLTLLDVGLPPANPRQVRGRLGRASRSLMPDEVTP